MEYEATKMWLLLDLFRKEELSTGDEALIQVLIQSMDLKTILITANMCNKFYKYVTEHTVLRSI